MGSHQTYRRSVWHYSYRVHGKGADKMAAIDHTDLALVANREHELAPFYRQPLISLL